jgi:putative ABC transport system permease protein
VQLDSWGPNNPYGDEGNPPDQLTYTDASTLLAAREARRQVVSYSSSRVIEPEGADERPFQINTRSTSGDFFAMFDTPFLYGNGWDQSADDNEEFVVVIGKELNERVFGGEDSVGRPLIMNGMTYRVTGVLDTWDPFPRFYDVTVGAFNEVEEAFFPFSVSIANEIDNDSNTNCWKPNETGGWAGFTAGECIWMQMWVELHGEAEAQEYLSFLDAYVEGQKELGRFQLPMNNRLSNVMEWMVNQEVVEEDVKVLLGLAGLFLIVCLLNTIGLLLAKIMRRAGDIGLRRALGASRRAIFSQYIVEAGVIGIAGGVLGVLLTLLGLQGIRMLYAELDFIAKLISIDWVMVFVAIILAIVSALVAALYPTWRACSIQPASQLKAL